MTSDEKRAAVAAKLAGIAVSYRDVPPWNALVRPAASADKTFAAMHVQFSLGADPMDRPHA